MKGRALPEWYLAKPEYRPGDDVYVNAFNYLSSGRHQSEHQVDPVHWHDIFIYARDLLGMDRDDAMAFMYILNQMDSEYLADRYAQAKGRAGVEDAKDRALKKGR